MNKENYSLFKKINEVNSAADKSNLILLIDDIISIIKVVYVEQKDKNISQENIIQYLLDIGVIEQREELHILKNILGNKYEFLEAAISKLPVLVEDIDINLKKIFDVSRKTAINDYNEDIHSPTIVDFFCGAGGLSLGFFQNGFKTLLANDVEPVCCDTYSYNHYNIPKDKIIVGDIRKIVDHMNSFIDQDVDVVIGGPPCQGFSMANRQRIIDDSRNELYKYYVKGISYLQPKFFVMENVKGMLSVAQQVVEDFNNLDNVSYDVAYSIFNASEFSVPQNRERLIYIGVRKDVCSNKFISAEMIIKQIKENSQMNKKFTLKDAIGDMKVLEALGVKNATDFDSDVSGCRIDSVIRKPTESEYVKLINCDEKSALVFNHKARFNNQRDIEIFGRMLPGDDSSSERIADIMPYSSRSDIFKDKYYKLRYDNICKTITAHMKFDCNMYIHPTQARGLTPREAARVQSYPDNYFFKGAYTKTYMQIGNSVPPLLSRAIAILLKKYL